MFASASDDANYIYVVQITSEMRWPVYTELLTVGTLGLKLDRNQHTLTHSVELNVKESTIWQ